MRVAIQFLPDGVYFGEDHTDNDCFEKVGYKGSAHSKRRRVRH